MPKTSHLCEFLARVDTSTSPGQVAAMQVSYLDRVTEADAVVMEAPGATAAVDYAGLAALMHDDDLAALKAAVDAEIASRA